MPSLHDLLKARFAATRQDLRQVLDRLSEQDLDWSPREGMRTIREQLLEIADKEVETLGWVATGSWPDDHEGAFAADASLTEIRARLDAIRADTLALVDSLDEESLRKPIAAPEIWWEALRLQACPFDEILRNIAAHEWYHTGQIVTYLWLMGDDPEAW